MMPQIALIINDELYFTVRRRKGAGNTNYGSLFNILNRITMAEELFWNACNLLPSSESVRIDKSYF